MGKIQPKQLLAGAQDYVLTSTAGNAVWSPLSGNTSLTSLIESLDTYVTGFTYNDSNRLTVSVNDGNDYSVSIDIMTGLTINGDLTANGNAVFSGDTDVVTIYGSESTSPIFSINGSSGQLFSVTDTLSGDIFSVNDTSGTTILSVNSDKIVTIDGSLVINTDITSGLTVGSTTVVSVDTTLGSGAYFDYYIMSGTTMRLGTVMAVWNGTDVAYTDTSTKDIGSSTSDVSFSVTTALGLSNLVANIDSGTWTIKTGVRII